MWISCTLIPFSLCVQRRRVTTTSFTHYWANTQYYDVRNWICSSAQLAAGLVIPPLEIRLNSIHSLLWYLSHNWKIVWRWNNRFSQQGHFLHKPLSNPEVSVISQVCADVHKSSALIVFLATVFDPAWPQDTGSRQRIFILTVSWVRCHLRLVGSHVWVKNNVLRM